MEGLLNTLKYHKEKFIIAACLVFAVISIISIFFLTRANSEGSDKPADDWEDFNDARPVQTYSPESPKSLEFRDTGENGCTVSGIGKYTGTELKIPAESPEGKIVIGIDAKAFMDCTQLVSIEIPDTVTVIGEQAFKGCSSLVIIEVDSANQKFCSVGGILYSKDKTKIICCPADRIGNSLLIKTNVKSISNYAFYGTENLKKIYYEGSTAEFESITIGRGNDDFLGLPITCNYISGK